MAGERAARGELRHGSILRGFASPKIWLLCTVYFLNTGSTAIALSGAGTDGHGGGRGQDPLFISVGDLI